MSTSAALSIVYATDEDIAIRDPDDFAVLTPHAQCLAKGRDGVFAAEDRWTLTSATVDFEAAGIAAGHVMVLKSKNVYLASGEAFAVESVLAGAVTLRRIGQAAGVGQPPGPADGLASVEFAVETLGPQIENESFELNRLYSIDPASAARSPESLYDLRDLRAACVLQVLLGRYLFAVRADQGDFKMKLGECKSALSEVKARLSIRWAPADGSDTPPTTTPFSTRLRRG